MSDEGQEEITEEEIDRIEQEKAEQKKEKREREDVEDKDEIDEKTGDQLLINLNRLAWILQRCTRNCVAVCFINNKLLISSNDIYNRTESNNPFFEYVEDIFNCLAEFVQNSNKKSIEERELLLLEKILNIILDEKFQGEGAGYLASVKDYKDTIFNTLSSFLKSNPFLSHDSKSKMKQKMLLSMSDIMCKASHSEPQIGATVGLCTEIVCRLINIARFLASDRQAATILKNAFIRVPIESNLALVTGKKDIRKITKIIRYEPKTDNLPSEDDINWLFNKNENGCAILALNLISVHAELRTLDLLIASGLIATESITQDETIYALKWPTYIGISKRCCRGCNRIIEIVNLLLNSSGARISYSGSHYMEFDSWWSNKPFFLIAKITRYSSTSQKTAQKSQEVSQRKRDKELIHAIQEVFEHEPDCHGITAAHMSQSTPENTSPFGAPSPSEGAKFSPGLFSSSGSRASYPVTTDLVESIVQNLRDITVSLAQLKSQNKVSEEKLAELKNLTEELSLVLDPSLEITSSLSTSFNSGQ